VTFCVLNEGGRDANIDFPDGAGDPARGGHPPVNHHAYAACLRGSFVRDQRLVPDGAAVLILLRRGNLSRAASCARQLRGRGCGVFVALKEAGGHQVAALLASASRWRAFREACASSRGAVASTPELVPLFEAAGAPRVAFVPTPYPLGVPGWEVATPLGERHGILIGTREFGVPSRNHLAAVAAGNRLSMRRGCRLTVLNTDGRSGARILAEFRAANPLLEVVEERLPHRAYLEMTSRHRLVLQFDASAVPGQVAGDALLAGTPCIGGDSAIERLVFTCPGSRSGVLELADHLLSDDAWWTSHMAAARSAAAAALSFEAVGLRLGEFLQGG
jgi:hypothetical protein